MERQCLEQGVGDPQGAAAALRYAVTESAGWATTVGLPIGGLAAAPGLSGPTEFEVLVEHAGVR